MTFQIQGTIILPAVYTGMELGLSHKEKNSGWWGLKTGCWEIYLALRGRKEQEAGGNGKMRSSMILHNKYMWSKQGGRNVKGMGEEGNCR